MFYKSLYALQDKEYKDFNSKLIPNIQSDKFIGIRTPQLRKFAKEMVKSGQAFSFIKNLPHRYFEENQIHAFILSEFKDFNFVITETERFFPYVDNWATCDQMSPHVFKKNLDLLFKYICEWIKSKDIYTVRFAIKNLMQYYMGDNFKPEYANMVANIKTDEYYINMMRAWYFATGMAKQPEIILSYLSFGKIDEWTRKHAIQKALESYRVSDKNKEILRSLR
ncbi:MAG: DNA alkylation repair protein [Alphaproteobacteria bacterium]|nr:DNA alkylation repair protein [Alphaproteobacteria bacterium]